MTRSLFQELELEWSDVVRSAAARDHLRSWAAAEPVLDRFTGLDDVVRFTLEYGHPGASDDVLRVFAAQAEHDQLAARVLLQALIPGLIPVAVSFRSAFDNADDSAAQVVTAAYERIRTYPIQRRPRRIAANIVLDTRQTVSRALQRRARFGEVPTAEIEQLVLAPHPVTAVDRLVHLVGDAVSRRVIDTRDARLILLSRVLDVSTADLAAEHRCLPQSLRRRRRRAETALAAIAV